MPTMAGSPSSRLTMAACDVRPPWSVTMAAARFMIGTQSGSVVSVTKIEPSTNLSISLAVSMRQTRPDAAASPMLRPGQSMRPFLPDLVGFQDAGFAARVHGFRPRLDDEQFARDAILGPFHVHRAAVMLFDRACPACQLQDLLVAEHEAWLALLWTWARCGSAARLTTIDHLDAPFRRASSR